MIHTKRFRLVLLSTALVPLVLISSRSHEAATSRTWVARDRSDFADAVLEGVSLTNEGALRLSARVRPVFDAAQPNLWCLARDASGRVYAGGGNDGLVFRFPAEGGEPELVFDADELEVHAITFDDSGRLHVATSPDGAVYRIDEGGIPVVVFDPEETYIWSIAYDDRGRLYVATGHPGRVHRVDRPGPGATGSVLLSGREEHIRTLVPSGRGGFYAGSDQNGILYRIDEDGTISVVYDSPMREIPAIAVVQDAEGKETIYVAGLAPLPAGRPATEPEPSGGVTRIRVTADENGEEGEEEEKEKQPVRRPSRPAPESYFGAVFAISPAGHARKIWESREVLPLSLAAARGLGEPGAVIVGTGNSGQLLLLTANGDATDYVTVPSMQINALLPTRDGRLLAAASNLGQVVAIDPGGATSGTVTSTVHDAGFTSSWGTIAWGADLPRGSTVGLQIRTGDTEIPDESWSEWSRPLSDPDGSRVPSPRSRFIQWRATLEASRGGGSPILRSISVGYLPDNIGPAITAIEILPPGIVLAGGGVVDQTDAAGTTRRVQTPPRRSFEKGMRAATWTADDANGDALRFDIYFKAEDESRWKKLAERLEVTHHAWDETSMPDGVYRLKVVASDAPANPPGTEERDARVSTAFDVDNTPPTVGPIRFVPSGEGSGAVTASIEDSFSAIAEVSYSLDAGDWIPIHPDDGIADASQETFRFPLDGLTPGEHTITVRARDRAGNTTAGKVVIDRSGS